MPASFSTWESDPTVCDFTRSFVRWRHDTTRRQMLTASQPPPTTLNNVRIPLECVAVVARHGTQQQFALSASCKTEQVFVEKNVWMNPNADMCAVCGDGQFLIIKRWDKVDKGVMLYPPSLGKQPERQFVNPAEAFESQTVTVRRRAARRLESIEVVIETLAGDREVISRTIYPITDGEVWIEYPVKTVNYSERHRYYQVDTGPVLFFGEPTGSTLVEHLYPAYIAHLGRDWAEFLVSVPTKIDELPVSVHHYSDVRHVSARNSLWVVED